ncbi:hypothetical protein [Actinotalea sp. Marseille-Q4924]|uniref:hypothetical protein n=1 Tax=Actinotalea sp. Marseille-Q4924 TaxID=2866571 RepID=UPI001CE4A2E2|nr:hypothetical protein [Actinotalea sp. Marseille-Q4924]
MRFLHVLGAVAWLRGQLTVSTFELPLVRRHLRPADRADLMRSLGLRLGRVTVVALVPLQVATEVALAWHQGLTLASLAEPGYGRLLAG